MIKIALFGFGGVGQALLKMIYEQKFPIEVSHIFDRSYQKKKEALLGIPASDDIAILNNLNEIDCIVELMGGISTPLFIIREALDRGIPVVTANKALLAEHGYALFMKMALRQTPLLFEAAVGGAIPIIQNLKSIFCHEEIKTLEGILNGTTNYILSEMGNTKKEQKVILKEAQKLGFAESDPILDINGTDASQKLAILATLIRHKWVDYHKIYTRGIQEINLTDIYFAERMKYRIKLISSFKVVENSSSILTEPNLVAQAHSLYNINFENNAVSFAGDYSKNHLFAGKGAGVFPTAYSVLSDILRIHQTSKNAYVSLHLEEEYERIQDVENIETPVYFRLRVKDKVGILEKISRFLSSQNISISSIMQEKVGVNDLNKPLENRMNIFIMTHKCQRKNVFAVINNLKREEDIINKPVYFAVKEDD